MKNSIKSVLFSAFLVLSINCKTKTGGNKLASSNIESENPKVSFNNTDIPKPNIIVILADDLGYADVGYHGSDIKTPHIDQLAANGVKLESFYVAPMCSPTRAGLLTGRYPIRFGMMRAVLPPYRSYGIDPNEDLLPEMLARAGYKHRGAIGKWHLGKMEDKWLPNNQGFTHFVGCYEGAIDYFTHFRDDRLDWHKNGELFHQEGYSTDLIAEESVSFINSVPKDEPYFLYVPFNAPHSPFQAKNIDLEKYPNRKGKQKTYAAMVDCMDQGIGEIIETVQKRGDLDNTFILFMSDNGGVKNIGDNSPMKGYKLTTYEGGIRVAAVAYWKGQNISGGGVLHERIGYIDVFSTLKEAVGLQNEPAIHRIDGFSFLGLLKGKNDFPKRNWFSYMDQGKERRQNLAVNSKNWKMVIEQDAPDALVQQEPIRQLYYLGDGHIENENVKEKNSNKYEELENEMNEFLKLIKKDQVPRYFVNED